MGHDRIFRICFGLALVLLVTPLWVATYPPLVDLPQHAAQVAIALHWHDAGAIYPRLLSFDYIGDAPLSFIAAYALAHVVPVAIAWKLVLSGALLATAWMMVRLIDTLGGRRWWVFPILPALYGYAFMWGFVDFVFAVPLALLLIREALRYREAPSTRGAWRLAGVALVLYFTHVLVLGYAGLTALALVAFTPTWRDRLRGAIALAVVLPIAVGWFVAVKHLAPSTTVGPSLDYGSVWYRVSHMLPWLVGRQGVTATTALAGALVLLLPVVLGARPARAAWRWAPLAAGIACYALMPADAFGVAFLAPRFPLFVALGVPLALEVREPVIRPLYGVLVGFAALWLALVGLQFHAFDRESAGARAVIAQAEPGKRMLQLDGNPRSAVVDWTPYLHFGQWYVVEGHGMTDFSFAEFIGNHFRYQAGKDPHLPGGIEWSPINFDYWRDDGASYDYFLVRIGPWLGHPFATAPARPLVVATAGPWLLLRRNDAPPAVSP